MSAIKKVHRVTNWNTEVEQRPYFNGTPVVKSNKTTVTPKAGATPLFVYMNKRGVDGDWYDVKDVIITAKPANGPVTTIKKSAKAKPLAPEMVAYLASQGYAV